MTDRFDEWLDENSRALKYQPDDPFVWSRLQARIQDRIRRPLTMYDVLFRWRRAVALTLGAFALASAVSIWKLSDSDYSASAETIMTADLASEDYYRVVP